VIPVAVAFEQLLADVVLALGDVQVMNRFERLATRTIDAFDLVSKVPIAVFLRKLCGRAVRRPPDWPVNSNRSSDGQLFDSSHSSI